MALSGCMVAPLVPFFPAGKRQHSNSNDSGNPGPQPARLKEYWPNVYYLRANGWDHPRTRWYPS